MTEQIRRTDIRADSTQSRARIDQDTLHDYAELLRDGKTLPPLLVFYDGEFYWLADGFHRYFAAQNLGLEFVECDVREGTLREALAHSLGANQEHGLRRTNEDKERAVAIALSDEEWRTWSDRRLAAMCGVSPTFVGTVRATFQVSTVDTEGSEIGKTGKTPRVGRDGQRQSAKKRGRKPKAESNGDVAGVFDPPPIEREWGEGDALEDVQADLKEFERRLRALSRYGREILRCEGNDISRPYCGCYSVMTLIQPLQHVARTVTNDLPVGGTPKKPLLFHEQKALQAATS